MNKTLLYIAAAALGTVALGACDDDLAYPPIAEPESEWVGMDNTSIKEIKEAYWQNSNNYNTMVGLTSDKEEVIIKGRVISSDLTGNVYNNVVVLGEDGYAITVSARAASGKKLASQYPYGAEVYINLSGICVGRYAGLFQIGQASGQEITFLSNDEVTEHMQANSIGYPELVDTLSVDLATIIAAKSDTEQLRYYMSRLVRIDGLKFQNAGQEFAPGTQAENRYATDASGARINVRCSNRSTWAKELIPTGEGSVVGILSYFNNDWQILMNDAEGCIGFTPAEPGPEPTPTEPKGDGTLASPYNVAAALKVIEEGPSEDKVYVKGKIAIIDEIDTGNFGNATYQIVDNDGGTPFKIYRGYWFNGEKFTSADQLAVGAEVIVFGQLVNFMGNSPQITQGSSIVSYNGETEGGDIPTPGKALYSESFQSGNLGAFTVENKVEGWDGWYAKASGPACAIANSYKDGTNLAADSWLISPVLDMSAATNVSLSVKMGFGFDFPTSQDEYYTVLIKAEGGEWTRLDITEFPQKGTGKWTSFAENTWDLNVYAGQKMQIAFRYINEGSKSLA